MNTSLVFCVLALSSSWAPPSTPDFDPSAMFRRAEPIGLFDEVTSAGIEVPVSANSTELLSAYNAANFGPAAPSHGSGSSKRLRFPSLLRAHRDAVIRAQSPALRLADGMPDEESIGQPFPRTFAQPTGPAPVPNPTRPASPTPTFSAPYEEPLTNQPIQSFVTPAPQPFTTAPPPGVSTWGANGSQPYRLGYSLWGDMGWLPARSTNLLLDDKKFEVFELNLGLNHTIPTWWSPWLFSLEHQFGYRSWNGPATVSLPGSVYRIGWDMRFETPLNSQFAPFAMTLAFNPSINSDFNQKLERQAINLDGRGIIFWQPDPHFMVGIGAQFWDRVTDRVIPYGGVVWLPDDRWEFRIMWPQSRIQYYCGNHMGEDVWLYASSEYHIESYQIGTASVAAGKDQIELEDYRIMIGMRKSNPIVSGFIEGGWVFGRKVDFRSDSVNDFNISSGFIGRIGLKF